MNNFSGNLAKIHFKKRKGNKTEYIITFKNKDHSSIPLYKELGILPLEKSFELKNAKHMWKLQNGYLPQCLSNLFNRNSRNQLTNNISRLNSLMRFPLFSGPKVWNELPQASKDKTTLKSFSEHTKTYYLNEL